MGLCCCNLQLSQTYILVKIESKQNNLRFLHQLGSRKTQQDILNGSGQDEGNRNSEGSAWAQVAPGLGNRNAEQGGGVSGEAETKAEDSGSPSPAGEYETGGRSTGDREQ